MYIKSLTIVSSVTPFVPTTLESISLNTSNVQKTFTVGDTFSSEGLVVTASYSDGTSKPVTNYSVSKPNMSTSGTKTVTISYAEDNVSVTATYEIVVKEKPAPVSSGCGGNIVATSVVLSALAAVGLVLLLIKRKKEN